MNTFLPMADFRLSAIILDKKRLGKQRVEGLQILNSLNGTGGWRNHPAVKMWKGYEGALHLYVETICKEWIRQGCKDTVLSKIECYRKEIILPPWLGDERLHASHRSNLLRKDYEYYRHFEWKEDSTLPYFWPS